MNAVFWRFQEAFIFCFGPMVGWMLTLIATMSIFAAIGYIWLGFLRWITRRAKY